MNTEVLTKDQEGIERNDISRAISEMGTPALFPAFTGKARTVPSQPAMFLVYLCGTWIAVRFVILILVFFGAMANPGFPWGFLLPIQPGANADFLDLFLALTLTLVVYARFFYRYNDYLFHVNPTTTPVDFILDCLVAISGVAVVMTAGNCRLLGLAFSALFAFAGLKYLQGYRVCRRFADQAIETDSAGARLWQLNAVIMRRKFLYDFSWVMLFGGVALLGIWPNRLVHAVVFSALIPSQLIYMHLGDPSQIALRYLNPAKEIGLWGLASAGAARLYKLCRPYSIPYVSLLGLSGLLSGGQSYAPLQLALALSLGPLVWVSMLSFHDFVHRRADARAGRDRDWASWILFPFGIASLLGAVGLASTAGVLTLVMVLTSALFGGLYGLAKGVPIVSNLVRGCVTSTGVLATAAIIGLTEPSVFLAAGAGLLDAAGNILGDVRDTDSDRKAGTMTIAVISILLANTLSLILLLGSVLLFSFLCQAVLPLLVVGISAIFFSREREAHLWFLMVKYSCVGVVALSLARGGVPTIIVYFLCLLAVPSILVYGKLHDLKRGMEHTH